MADWIERRAQVAPAAWRDIARRVRRDLNERDTRFWFGQVPGLAPVRDATDPDAALRALIDLLRNPRPDGPMVVSIPYLMMKISLASGSDRETPWVVGTNTTYQLIAASRERTDRIAPEPTNVTTMDAPAGGSGITLRHQPNREFVDPAHVPTTRPALRNLPVLQASATAAHRVTTNMLDHGLPFASGLSGSINMMMHLLEYLRAQQVPVDPHAFLTATMMFMTQDGGHSLQEVAWVANLLDARLELGLRLNQTPAPEGRPASQTGIRRRRPQPAFADRAALVAEGRAVSPLPTTPNDPVTEGPSKPGDDGRSGPDGRLLRRPQHLQLHAARSGRRRRQQRNVRCRDGVRCRFKR